MAAAGPPNEPPPGEEYFGDMFFPEQEWPRHIRDIWNRRLHADHSGRFQLFLFFVGNGMPPEHARWQILSRWRGQFDASAVRSINRYVQDFNARDPRFMRYSYFDLRHNFRLNLGGDPVENNGHHFYHEHQYPQPLPGPPPRFWPRDGGSGAGPAL